MAVHPGHGTLCLWQVPPPGPPGTPMCPGQATQSARGLPIIDGKPPWGFNGGGGVVVQWWFKVNYHHGIPRFVNWQFWGDVGDLVGTMRHVCLHCPNEAGELASDQSNHLSFFFRQ